MAKIAAELWQLVEQTVEGLGCELVDLERLGAGLLRVTLDTQQPGGIGLADCERVSRQLTHLFAVEHVVYDRLEVSSPGLDRPLRKLRDFERFVGAAVALQLHAPRDGKRRLRVELLAAGGAPGGETIRVRELPPEPPAGRPRGAAVKKAAKKAAPALPQFDLALAEIDKARLVPVVDFGSKARAARAAGGMLR